jgi:hypothetical protein
VLIRKPITQSIGSKSLAQHSCHTLPSFFGPKEEQRIACCEFAPCTDGHTADGQCSKHHLAKQTSVLEFARKIKDLNNSTSPALLPNSTDKEKYYLEGNVLFKTLRKLETSGL